MKKTTFVRLTQKRILALNTTQHEQILWVLNVAPHYEEILPTAQQVPTDCPVPVDPQREAATLLLISGRLGTPVWRASLSISPCKLQRDCLKRAVYMLYRLYIEISNIIKSYSNHIWNLYVWVSHGELHTKTGWPVNNIAPP